MDGSSAVRVGCAYFPIRIPYIYGIKTKAGHAVLVQTPNACGAEIIKRIPADFMPLILWADKADDLEFLTAYTSDAGYQHPSAHLKLRSVTIVPASVGEYEAWTRSAPRNIVVRGKDPFEADASSTDWRYIRVAPGQDPGTAKYGSIGCYGLVRYPIPDSIKDDVRANWPADRPRF
ncbi:MULTISPECIES: hypothetical protein [unclassified Bradyrhizobium]|uniref:hypothetical protein n=1 Tax=unclassified Bradyrhizobium TaxID=2631580 RepID=UPI001BAD2DCB|nr:MULTISPECIES: hypothetical protein [unclassified Bradyrhizobium]MBR1224199.1 hypothetical protein [Bradyrhizobium sp. AUGA SZCCT0176]MBR1301830.1 hypothetical protein [Bradyrhizobium sp. AUGA SZCCT0042]